MVFSAIGHAFSVVILAMVKAAITRLSKIESRLVQYLRDGGVLVSRTRIRDSDPRRIVSSRSKGRKPSDDQVSLFTETMAPETQAEGASSSDRRNVVSLPPPAPGTVRTS